MDPIFDSLGKRLGNVGLIDARAAKVQVEINMDRPLRFALRAQLSTDEGSSARKSLNFEAPSHPPSIHQSRKPSKSWYEMTLEEEGSMTEEAMNSKAPPQTLNNSTLPLTERLLEEEDWLDDGNDFADVYGNDFGEEDIDLMEEDDLLGEELRIENEKHLQINDSRIKRADGGATLEITDGSGSGKVVESTVDSKNKTPTKGTSSSSDRFSGSSASMKKKRGSRSRSTFGLGLALQNPSQQALGQMDQN
ncbi:hypothetical protein HID58_064979 [Brassica napus]|uniref:Uncharacterized protein n=1 Tax=Brassica napus TaxID=3708 RepID=A0ABQ7ZBX4_BRANA|nr:hypothetical protein HID58_064979 [Brassica napus]